jgi:hypothetical protein
MLSVASKPIMLCRYAECRGALSLVPLNLFQTNQAICEHSRSLHVSISPIFYEQRFHTRVFCAAFMCFQIGFVIFWQKDFGTKAAHKMLVKLTPGWSTPQRLLANIGRICRVFPGTK